MAEFGLQRAEPRPKPTRSQVMFCCLLGMAVCEGKLSADVFIDSDNLQNLARQHQLEGLVLQGVLQMRPFGRNSARDPDTLKTVRVEN